jgi:uncharacterized protein YggT (Ycf19 family)
MLFKTKKMSILIKLIVEILILGMFLYSKLLPYSDRLNVNYKKIFNFFKYIFDPILTFFKRYLKPFKVGNGVAIDLSQFLLLLIFLFILFLA